MITITTNDIRSQFKKDMAAAFELVSSILAIGSIVTLDVDGVVISNVFPEKKKRQLPYHYIPSSDGQKRFMEEFDGLVSWDMFDKSIAYVNLYNIQIHL